VTHVNRNNLLVKLRIRYKRTTLFRVTKRRFRHICLKVDAGASVVLCAICMRRFDGKMNGEQYLADTSRGKGRFTTSIRRWKNATSTTSSAPGMLNLSGHSRTRMRRDSMIVNTALGQSSKSANGFNRRRADPRDKQLVRPRSLKPD